MKIIWLANIIWKSVWSNNAWLIRNHFDSTLEPQTHRNVYAMKFDRLHKTEWVRISIQTNDQSSDYVRYYELKNMLNYEKVLMFSQWIVVRSLKQQDIQLNYINGSLSSSFSYYIRNKFVSSHNDENYLVCSMALVKKKTYSFVGAPHAFRKRFAKNNNNKNNNSSNDDDDIAADAVS